MKVAALVLADATAIGVRVRGEALLTHALRGLGRSGLVDHVVVTGPPAAAPLVRASGVGRHLPAGANRADSIRLAFEAAGSCDVFLVHDAARAFVPPVTIDAVAQAICQGAEAVAPVLPVTDTVKLVGSDDVIMATEDRTRLRTLQTPFGFTAKVLREACDTGADPLTSPPCAVRPVPGHPNAIRLATPFDVAVAEALLREERDEENGRA
jgi:2-C-methyl-D-erythritol 4-phosphate cytidylyltransferase